MLLRVLQILVLLAHIVSVDMCKANTYPHCHSWSRCSKSCGGGTRKRMCESCILYQDKWFHEGCNEICWYGHRYSSGRCQCPSWRYGECCENCRHINIPHCVSGQQVCGGSPDNIRCTKCNDPYYASGYGGNSCKACPNIDHCISRHCTSRTDTKCITCEDNNLFFKKTTGDTKCERLCSYNNHFCWPGTCGDSLTKNCICTKGFRPVSIEGETSCHPAIPPEIETCDTVVIGPNGEKRRAMSDSKSTACKFLNDMYGNYQPTLVTTDMMSTFEIDISKVLRPAFIKEEKFGITDTNVKIVKKQINDSNTTLSTYPQLIDTNKSTRASTTYQSNANVTVNQSLVNGEALCVHFEAFGGGYLKSINISSDSHTVSDPVPYHKIKQLREICYRFDSAKPIHCKSVKTCNTDPIQIQKRVTRSSINVMSFKGWLDPVPAGGLPKQTSGIEKYQVTVNEVLASKGKLKVDTTVVFTKAVNESTTSVKLNITSDKPRLYSLTLEVKDVADNVRQARRFMLYDNTSFIETNQDKHLRIVSASTATNFAWQTHHHNICLAWNDYFYNRFYLENELLNPIEPDPFGFIKGVYEQIDGVLPVSGTPNVFGIVRFMMSWSLNDNGFSPEIEVQNVLNQSLCKNFSVKDGQTYKINIRAVDIADNTYSEIRSVHIDRSAPHIENIWLSKDGYRTLFVHHNTDLSNMSLHFDALDPHSGIKMIEWAFGTSDSGTELSNGKIRVGSFNKTSCPNDVSNCYCPDIGTCEYFHYTVPLNKLVAINKHNGNHNRNYYFTIKVSNNAQLQNIEHVDILVDDSPPEVGVVYEGPAHSNDIDYTSADSFLINWYGFIDHESGIKEYRIGLAYRCLKQGELYNFTHVPDIDYYTIEQYSKSIARIPAQFTGKRFISIIALNNAMDPSYSVCSDGITRDLSPPFIRNLTLEHASWSESIVCHNGHAWIFHSSLSKIKLHDVSSCNELCKHHSLPHPLASALPTRHMTKNDSDISQFMCKSLRKYVNDSIVYLPTDHIKLDWDIEEHGSQIDDVLVGIGTDPTEVNAPSIDAYISTSKHNSFKRMHEGIGSDELFFIFVKVVNKASQERVSILGPILVDETPPICRFVPKAIIENDDIIVGWENDTFFDIEQKEEISSIYFEIGHDNIIVTPLFEWNLKTSFPCSGYSGGCFRYAVKRLQKHDNDLGLSFYINMHVYNNAGHFITVPTDTFRIPSAYPPGHGIVLDSDPDSESHKYDTNIHFTPHTLCLKWSGFKHHESVEIQVGIGSNISTDDVVPFINLNYSTSYHCIHSPKIKFQQIYFALVKASSTGGVTISSSNGIVVLNKTNLLESLVVNIGEKCSTVNLIRSNLTISRADNTSVTFQADIGKRYQLSLAKGPIRFIVTNDGIIERDTRNNKTWYFVSYVTNPTINIISYTRGNNQTGVLIVYKCPYAKYKVNKSVSAHWFYDNFGSYGLTYEIALLRKGNKTDNVTFLPFKQYESASNRQFHTFFNINFELNKYYKLAVKQCSNVTCLDPVLSEVFSPIVPPKPGRILVSRLWKEVNSSCTQYKLQWDAFKSVNNVLFYQWAVFADTTGKRILTEWQTEKENDKKLYEVNPCISLPVHLHSKMFGCIRAFDRADAEISLCQRIEYITNTPYLISVVYDFDASSDSWMNIFEILPSSNVGEHYTLLHDNELDFGTLGTDVVGAMLYASERNITWFLMTDNYVPVLCELNNDCIVSKVTNSGFVSFESPLIKLNIFYYICAYSNTTSVERELYTETFDEIKTCSNGFVLDSKAPVTGKVKVRNNNGFITSLDNFELSWNGFRDNVNATRLGYSTNIQSYSFGIGSRPKVDDIRRFVNVGARTGVDIDITNVPDGSAIFITVKATDHAGNTASSYSEELIIDTSPPLIGNIEISTIGQAHDASVFITHDRITVHLSGFEDDESGIEHFEIGVGSQPFLTDVLSPRLYHDSNIVLSIEDISITDGHIYYITAKAVNRAGLSSEFASLLTIADKTSPNGGHVFDGLIRNKNDEDYQTDIREINVHWNGFSDPHSGIVFYRACLGTRPFSDNIEAFVYVGLLQHITWHREFSIGERYFTTVEACNGAGLCISRSSDGIVLDTSPPLRGSVQIGSDELHKKYQSHMTSVHVTWAGFEDPESGIDHYEMCIGTSPTACDILKSINCLLQSNIIKTGLNLPTGTPLFATVTAYNKLQLNVTKSSDSFYVDGSYPVISIKPSIVPGGNNINGKIGQWDRSVLHIQWKFDDNESPIVHHYVSLITHHEGHTPVENIQLGAENNITISLDGKSWLHNGDTYLVTVTSCNLAGLCTSASSNDLIIDSTPPHIGGFKPPMFWENFNGSDTPWKSNMTLSWYGFHDQESKIERYFITISRKYSGNELTNGVAIIKLNKSENRNEYSYSFPVNEFLNRDDKLYLSIWAENSVGLNSSLARVSVSVLSSSSTTHNAIQRGDLELEKHSCDVHYCNKDCSCAVVGKPCVEVQTNTTCTEVNTSLSDQEYPKVKVFNGLEYTSPNITASSACLSGSWTVASGKSDIRNISRFEWSMGLQNQPVGEGVFDLRNENPWNDVGLQTKALHCLPVNKTLIAREKYVLYVRAWISSDSYATFYSSPIIVDNSPPSLVRGRTILDSDELCNKDFDLIDWMHTITACWDRVFSEQQGAITKYFLSMGTYPFGDDVIHRRDVGIKSRITFTNLTLKHGTKYFFTVTAYNNVGLHTSAISDGFIVDMDDPVSGVVYNTINQKDIAYQSSTSTIGLSWHGFHDSVSGIRNYYAAISETQIVGKNTNFKNIGLRTNYVFRNLDLKDGMKYYGIVKAIDDAGHSSTVAVSNGVKIDSTPPTGCICQNYTDINHFSDVSFANNEAFNLHFNASLNILYKVTGYVSSDIPRQAKLFFHMDTFHSWLPLLQYHNQTYFFEETFSAMTSGPQSIQIEIQSSDERNATLNMTLLECNQEIDSNHEAVRIKQISRSLLAVQMLVTDKERSISKIQVGAGTNPKGFQIRSLSSVYHFNHNHIIHTEALHGTNIYATAIIDNKAGLRTVFQSQPITLDHTIPIINNLSRRYRLMHENVSGVIETKTIVLASWKVADDESGILICYCSIGRSYHLQDIQSSWIAQTKTSCESMQLNLSHGQLVFLNLKCFNNVGLSNVVVADPFAVSIEPPSSNNADISFVPQNKENNRDIARSGSTVPIQSNHTCLEFKWNGFADISGISHYEYRVYQSGRNIPNEWVKTEKDMTKLDVDYTNGEVIAEARAINAGQLISNSVNSSLIVARFPPRLSGVAMYVRRNGKTLHLNWADTFDMLPGVPFSFSVTIGTRRGYTDIRDIEYISVSEVDVTVPESTIITPNVKEIFIAIDCVYFTGLRATYVASYNLA